MELEKKNPTRLTNFRRTSNRPAQAGSTTWSSQWFELWVSLRLARWDAQLSLLGSEREDWLTLWDEIEQKVWQVGERGRISKQLLLDQSSIRRELLPYGLASFSTSQADGNRASEPLGPIPASIPKTLARFLQGLSPVYEEAAVERYRLGRYQFLAASRAALGLLAAPVLASEARKRWIFEPLVRYAWNTYHRGAFLSEAQQRLALHELRGFEEALFFEERLSHLPNAEVFIGDRARELQIPGQQEAILQQRRREVLERYNDESISALVNLAGDVTLVVGRLLALVNLKFELIILRGVLVELFFNLDDPLKCFWLYYSAELFLGFHSSSAWNTALSAARRRIGLEDNETRVKLRIATVPVRLDTLFKYWVFRHLSRLAPTTSARYYQLIESFLSFSGRLDEALLSILSR